MAMSSTVELRADFPDDQIEDEDDIVQFGGRNVAQALGEALTAVGYQVSEPIDGQEQGWELDITRGGKPLWLQVASLGDQECILTAKDNPPMLSRADPQLLRTFLDDLERVLTADPRFSDIRPMA